MNGRAALLARGGVLGLIVLLGIGYLRFNMGVDAFYNDCRQTNDIAVCDCTLEGYTAAKNIFTEAPVFDWFLGQSDRMFAQQMGQHYDRCGYTA